MPSLLHRIQFDHDETAFQEFYKENVFRLFQFAFSFVQNKEVAEEIVNDVFLRLWQNRENLDRIDNMNVYLYVAIKNTAANYHRKMASRNRVDLDNVMVSHFYLSPDPEQVLVTGELRKAIEESVNQLPPKCKLIFKLVKEDGLSCQEVASILGLHYKTITTQLTIALKKLEQTLQPSLAGRRVRGVGSE
ncbi:MAG: RNA polymerase sigma-70 factor [Puia sp.]|nr:RNA polymerase sigma-70 factor [Puia sp.]